MCKHETASLPYSGVRPPWWQDLQSINYHNEYSTFTIHYIGQLFIKKIFLQEIELECLEPLVLQINMAYWAEIFAQDPWHDTVVLHHAAYRHFVLWRRGRFDANVRRVIPSCVVCRIRDRFPSTNGLYTGVQVSWPEWLTTPGHLGVVTPH